jgi:hypothetical protein
MHQYGHHKAMHAAELVAANTLIADLRMQLREKERTAPAGTGTGNSAAHGGGNSFALPASVLDAASYVQGVVSNLAQLPTERMDPIERMLQNQAAPSKVGHPRELHGDNIETQLLQAVEAKAVDVAGDAELAEALFFSNNRNHEAGGGGGNNNSSDQQHSMEPDASALALAAALSLDSDEEEVPGGHTIVETRIESGVLSAHAKEQLEHLTLQIGEQQLMIASLQHELNRTSAVADAADARHVLEWESAEARHSLALQEALVSARTDSVAMHTSSEYKLKAEVFKLHEELTAVKQQFIEICGEKHAVERRIIELDSRFSDQQSQGNIRTAAAQIEIATLAQKAAAATSELEQRQTEAAEFRTTSRTELATLTQKLEQMKQEADGLERSLAAAREQRIPPAMIAHATQTDVAAAMVSQETQALPEMTAQAAQTDHLPDEASTSTPTAASPSPTNTPPSSSNNNTDMNTSTAVNFLDLLGHNAPNNEEEQARVATEMNDLRSQLVDQQAVHSAMLDTTAAAAALEKSQCLKQLQTSYQGAIQTLVGNVEEKMNESRRSSTARLQRALQRGTDLVAKKLNARYLSAIQLIFEHVVEISGEAAAQSLAVQAFESEGFKVRVTTDKKRTMHPHANSTAPMTSTPRAVANLKREHANSHDQSHNQSRLNQSALLTPSPTPSPQASPNNNLHLNSMHINASGFVSDVSIISP